MTDSATQILGVVDGLIAQEHAAFAYPEIAQVTPLLSDGLHERNYVLQSSALSVRQARRSWVVVPTADMHTLRGYASTKEEVALVEEDGTTRPVVVMDFDARERFVGYWDISATLVETGDPSGDGS
jgi:hypothetical protein